jgi:hypothetical protein
MSIIKTLNNLHWINVVLKKCISWNKYEWWMEMHGETVKFVTLLIYFLYILKLGFVFALTASILPVAYMCFIKCLFKRLYSGLYASKLMIYKQFF